MCLPLPLQEASGKEIISADTEAAIDALAKREDPNTFDCKYSSTSQ